MNELEDVPEKIIMPTSSLLPPQPESPVPTTTTTTTTTIATIATTSKSAPPAAINTNQRDFLTHLETYLAKRDGVDKLLKISRYATKILLTASPSTLPPDLPLSRRLKSFESSVGLSRKAFRLGKFIQDVNALRASVSVVASSSTKDRNEVLLLSIIAYGGEGVYYFIEQFIWLAKTGLIDPRHARDLQKLSAWAEFVGYIGSIGLKVRDLRKLNEEKACLDLIVSDGEEEDFKKLKALELKLAMKKFSIVQDLADGLMAVGDIRDGKGKIFSPFVLSCAGLLSALISTHKNWISC